MKNKLQKPVYFHTPFNNVDIFPFWEYGNPCELSLIKKLKNPDLIPVLDGRNRISEILGRKRELAVSMIKALNKNLNIPDESLIF